MQAVPMLQALNTSGRQRTALAAARDGLTWVEVSGMIV
jgi:hypothetical protein